MTLEPGATLDVFQNDEEGEPTTIRVAEATVENDGTTLKVTFVDPVDTETDDAYYVGDPAEGTVPATQTEGKQQLEGIDATIELPVSVSAELLGEEPGELAWTLQTSLDDPSVTQAATLKLPAAPADEPEEDAASEDAVEEDAENVISTQAEGNDAVTDSIVTTEAGAFTAQVSVTITWCDNNSGRRPKPEALANGFAPEYSLDNGRTYKPLLDENGNVSQQAIADLHLDPNDIERLTSPFVNITQTSVNTYQVLSHTLPENVVTTTVEPQLDEKGNPLYDENGNQLFYGATYEYQPITWRLVDKNTYPGYMAGQSSTSNHLYKMLTTNVTFNVVGKTGDEALKDIFGSDDADDFLFGATIDGADKDSTSVAQAVAAGNLHITDTETGCTITGTLPMYDSNGFPIVYYIRYNGEQNTNDYYQPSYDNSASASHGSATDAVYNGGTMTLRHAGKTSYYGTKVWLDGGAESRPEVTFTLWRYSLNGGSASTASQVSLATSDESGQGTATNAASYVQVTIPVNSAGTVDLHDLLVQTYGEDAINSLPKYDPDGYPYVYALREDAVSGYEQVFGQVNANGSVNDTPPTYQNADGGWTTVGWNAAGSDERPANDHFIYNGGDNEGEGVISNRLTGNVTADLTKTWEIAAFQDSFQDAVCTFQAQSRTVDPNDGDDWTNVSGANATQTLTDWNAETLTKTLSESFPKYDAHGNELEYRWVETNVTLGEQNTDFTTNDNGTASFQIDVTDAEGNPETLEFTSVPETTRDNEGNVQTTIVNSFNNVTDRHVDKYWEQADGTQAQYAPDPAYSDGNATVELYQDGKLVGTFTMDGHADDEATPIDGLGDATWQETRSYHIDFENLPKYSEGGVRHTYLVLETSKTGWNTERTYDPETRTTRIDNYLPEGEGSEIRVTKTWLDGDDASHRYTVRVELVANDDMHSQATNPDGSYVTEYKQGQVVATVDLSAEELWYAEVDVPIGGLSYKDFTAREAALVDDNGTPDDTTDDTTYPVVSKEEAEANYSGEAWVNAGWTNPANHRVATPEHVYEVKSVANDDMGACGVTNRRLGLLDLTVTKSWQDGLGDDPADNPRPKATLTLSCDEYAEAFSLDGEGNLQVSVSGNTLPVTDAEGNPVKATIVDAEGNPTNCGNARVEVDTTKASSTYTFFGLPKYDAQGLNVHYSVEEDWAENEDAGDYHSTKNVGPYNVVENARHFEDNQQIDFTNSRSGTRDVVFYKIWHDNYVSEVLNQRPDIYLTLYRVGGDGTPEVVDGCVHFSWSAAAEGGDAANEQKVTISGLQKYDEDGAEYTYYATETMSADGTSLGYGNVTFDYESIDGADEAATETHAAQDAKKAIKVDESAGSNDPTQDGTGWAIREDGTFVNRLDDDLVAKGTKLWESVPGNVSQEDLPAVTVYLQRKRATANEWPAMEAVKNADGTWTIEGTVASTSTLVPVGNNQYTYTIDKDYQGEALPRYDENGNLYEYRAFEIVWGLLNQPGGFTENELLAIEDLNEVRDGDNTSLTNGVYIIQHGETGSFLLRNVYKGETGKLTVKKLLAGDRNQGDPYPQVTFDVYRYYVNDEGVASNADYVTSGTIDADDFKTDASSSVAEDPTVAGELSGSATATLTFDKDLEIYAPDGSLWIYYVVERNLGGHETVVGTGNLDWGDEGLKTGSLVNADGDLVESGESAAGMRSENLGTFENGDITDSVIKDDNEVDVTFGNTYEPGSTNLSGRKVWHDFNDIFTARPNKLNLTFTRTAGGLTEDVEIQDDNPDGANYLTWDKSDADGDWTFSLKNVEEWAPNGQRWVYTVTEGLPDGAKDHYTVVVGKDSVTAGTDDKFQLENALSGSATIEKQWNDGDNPYSLRPENVTVQLQARYKSRDAGSEWSEWQDAYDVWKLFATEEQLAKEDFTEAYTQRTLSDGNGWKGSWRRLPVLARKDADDPLNDIEYRVVEVKIGDQDISNKVNNKTGDSSEGVYDTGIVPYQPSQVSWTGSATTGWATKVSNTLEDVSISATKTWGNDYSDAWGTRPEGSGDSWEATYFLQQSADGGTTWQWVVEAGSDADPSLENGSPLQDGVVSLAVSGSDASATATWDYLPKYDTAGNLLKYRVLEQVPGSYEVTDDTASVVTTKDPAHRYYVVESTPGTTDEDPSGQTFTNTLRTTSLTGTKLWYDHGTGMAPAFDEGKAPQMTLWRQAEGGAAEQVKMKDGSPAAQPDWTEGEEGAWVFTYENLPAADEQDHPYTYWAVEQAGTGAAKGYYPTYGGQNGSTPSGSTHGASGTTTDHEATASQSGQQTNETITNVATRLTLDKLSDDTNPTQEGEQTEEVDNVQLTVKGADDNKTYAVWERDADGNETSKVWPEGTNDTTTDGTPMTGENAGFIVGLPAGTYTVTETSEPPAGYAQASPVHFTIGADGSVTSNDADVEGGNAPSADAIITVKVVDPVLRGHLSLTKYVSEDGITTDTGQGAKPLEGATFDLYRVDTDEDHDKVDDLIATGLTSNAQGVVTTVGNNAEIEKKSSDGTFDLTYGGRYVHLSDGLPEGEYYFVETATTSDAVMPDDQNDKSLELKITQDDHYDSTGKAVSAAMPNEEFSATVELMKYDSTSLEGINGAEFTLSYRPEGAPTDDDYTVVGTFTTGHDDTLNKDGVLVLPDLKKGDYLLTETANAGYDVEEPFKATFTIDNDDHDRTFMVWQDGGTAIDFHVESGTLYHGAGIPNDRLPGTASLVKQGHNGQIDATFDLQMKQDDGSWQTIVEDLATSNTYALDWGDDGTATATKTGSLDTGRLTVTGLTWGTYRFQETATSPGYKPENADGAITSSEFTINEKTPNMTVGNLTVSNERTDLQINKRDTNGRALSGATFEVAGVDGATLANGSASTTITTNGSGLARLTGQLVVGSTYTLRETSAPSGYDPLEGVVTFTVAADGSLEVQGDLPEGYEWADLNGDDQSDNAFSFMVTDPYVGIDLVKVDAGDGEPLKGVTFRLQGLCMDNETTHEYTTGEDGKLTIDAHLLNGVVYTLTEVAAPDGFVTLEDPLRFEIGPDGEIDVTGKLPEGWSIAENGVSITAANKSVDLQITKVGHDGEPLEGAVFSIKPVDGSRFANRTSFDELQLQTGPDGNLRLNAELMVGGTYDITEVSAPDGFERVTGTMRVTVAEDGSIEVLGSVGEGGTLAGKLPPTGYEKVDESAFEVRVTNEPIEIGIKKVDATDTATPLAGATFEVTGVFANGRDAETRPYTTDDQGRIDFKAELTSGETYTLRETVAPAGFELIEGELTFEVHEDGTLSATDELPEGYSIEQGNVTIAAADQPLEISLVKRDEAGEPLDGATFTVAPAEGTFPDGSAEKTFVSDADGVVFSELQVTGSDAGTRYTVTETVPAAGYEALPAFDLLVFADGTVKLADDAPEAVRAVFTNEQSEEGVAVLGVSDTPIEASLTKLSANGEPLAGATFQIEGTFTDGMLPHVVTVGEDGTAPLEGLVAGETYTLRETLAPEGYELVAGELTFAVGMDGTLELVGEVPAGYELSADGLTLTATDEPIEARIVKLSTAGDALDGATFEVTGRFAGSDEAETRELSAGIEGAELEGLVAGETYTVVETAQPNGFELVADEWSFTVSADGTLAPAEGFAAADEGAPGYRVADDGVTLVATDAPIELQIAKLSTEGKALAGAEFEVSGRFADGSSSQTVVVGEDGTAPIAGVVAGETYQVRETLAPEGFDLIEGTWAFAVANDGTIAPAEGATAAEEGVAGYRVADDGVTLVATDAPTPTEEPPEEPPSEEPPSENPPTEEPPTEEPPAEEPPTEEPPVENPPSENPPDEPRLPDTSDATHPTTQVALAAGGVAMIAAALAYRRRARREDQ